MNKHLITAIIILMTLSLVGIIGFQLFWINHALRLKEEQFDRQVSDALKKVVEKLETREAVDVISEQIKTIHLTQNSSPTVIKSQLPPVLPTAKLTKKKYKKKELRLEPGNATTASAVMPNTQYFPALHSLDSATLLRLTRLNSYVDTSKLHENVNKKLIWLTADTVKKNVFFVDSVYRAIYTRQGQLIPAKVRSIGLTPVKVDSLVKMKGFRMAADQVIITNNRPVDRTIIREKPEEHRRIQYSLVPETHLLPAARPTTFVARIAPSEKLGTITLARPATQPLRQETPVITPNKMTEPVQVTEQKKKVTAKTNQLTEVVQKMAVEYVRKTLPLQKRLPQIQLDSLVKNELKQAGIKLPFEYAVVMGQHHQEIPIRTANYRPSAAQSQNQYQARLFPNDIYTEPNFLTLQFPNRNAYLLHSFRYMMGFSALFTLIIFTTFLVTVHTILKQKKISEIKNDFINNMTHEFKTPLATISLAVDAIANPKILENKDRIKKYAGIIRDENKRMHKQVEDVLQMALLDKQELKLNLQPLSLHPLMQQAIQNMQLLLESKGGNIHLQLEALEPVVLGDEAHLGNVIGNLLDNAIKYSAAAPNITVITTSYPAGVMITVTDKGLGMSRETQQRIFDKFYRVSTGNLHPVKGFGLGLAYVKAIVVAHKGQIKVSSELGHGSSFEIKLPTCKTA